MCNLINTHTEVFTQKYKQVPTYVASSDIFMIHNSNNIFKHYPIRIRTKMKTRIPDGLKLGLSRKHFFFAFFFKYKDFGGLSFEFYLGL